MHRSVFVYALISLGLMLVFWLDLPNYEAHIDGNSVFLLAFTLPAAFLGLILNLFSKRIGRCFGCLVLLFLSLLCMHIADLAGWCPDCDEIPPNTRPWEQWVLQASSWADAHPNIFRMIEREHNEAF